MQAFLEVEPHRRGPKEEYRRRYEQFAHQELESALKQWDELLERIGLCLSALLLSLWLELWK